MIAWESAARQPRNVQRRNQSITKASRTADEGTGLEQQDGRYAQHVAIVNSRNKSTKAGGDGGVETFWVDKARMVKIHPNTRK